MPSAEQKRPWAKGRSAEITSTCVLSSEAAASLNLRVEVAQVGVSRLGTILRTLRLPAKSASVLSLRLPATSLKSGAVSPTLGRLPATVTALPPRVTLDMLFLLGVMGKKSLADNPPQAGLRHQGVLVPRFRCSRGIHRQNLRCRYSFRGATPCGRSHDRSHRSAP